jgi:hypothetical protein
MWVTNCEGEADRPVSLLDLHFVSSSKDQTALFFEVLDHTRAKIPRNSHFLIKNCTFDGPGGTVMTTRKDDLEFVNTPPGIDVIEGR